MSAQPANPASPILPVLFFLLLHLAVPSAGASVTNPSVQQCKSDHCGDDIEIRYPLWYHGEPNTSYCGYSYLGVVCEDNKTLLKLGDDKYRVATVDYSTSTITLQDVDLPSSDCSIPRHNLTLENGFSLVSAGVDVHLLFFINCSRSIIEGGYEIPCLGRGGGKSSYVYSAYENISPSNDWWGVCDEFVAAPVLETLLQPSLNNLSLSFGDILRGGFELWWSQPESSDCRSCEKTGGKCGNASNGDLGGYHFRCLCNDGTFGRDCSGGGSQSSRKRSIIIGVIAAGVSGFALVCIISCCQIYKKHSTLTSFLGLISRNPQNIETFLEQYGSSVPRRYKFADIKKMTRSFNEKLGQGGYGTVYKGMLQDGKVVAVKLLIKSDRNGEEFINEVASIGRTHHINIVCLLGFCCEGSKRALIYEFMPNGSLEKIIFMRKPRDMTLIGWEKLLKIAIGIARGLEYLHRGCIARIVHFDIKPHNILLDEDFCPKISDFGLAKSCHPKQSVLSTMDARGTIGYIAPEVFSRRFGVISSKSDVYSYGMMVLEMVSGTKNVDAGTNNTSEVYFPHWIYDHFNEGGVLKFCSITSEMEEVAKKMILVGLWCIQTRPSSRPSMSNVLEMLEGNFKDLQMPPRPYLCSP